jgi:hypothetical protein
MARIVVGVAKEVLRGEFPIGGKDLFVNADNLIATFAPVATIQGLIQVILGVAEIGKEIGRFRVPGRPDRSL